MLQDTELLSLNETQSTLPPGTADNPWQSFVRSETHMAARIVHAIHSTLLALYVAVKEIDSMSTVDLATVHLITDNQVPLEWRQIWPTGPKVLTDFLRFVVSRGQCAVVRSKNTRSDSAKFLDAMPLNDVFNLQAFLYALKLTNAR